MKTYTYMVIGKRIYDWYETGERPEEALANVIEKIMCFDDGCRATIIVYSVDSTSCNNDGTNSPVCNLIRRLRVGKLTIVEVNVKTWAGRTGEVKCFIAVP